MPELMEAWDEFSIDYYPDGWSDVCEAAIKSWGDDLVAHRYIRIAVDLEKVQDAFAPATVEGQVS
jgi:hypothetical protein